MRHGEDGGEHVYPESTEQLTHPQTWVGGWLSPILVTVFTLAWVFLIFGLIGNRPRDWQYGVIPYVPGQSQLSLQLPPEGGNIPRQVILPSQGGR